MLRPCCRPSKRLGVASAIPGALGLLLPKCPACLPFYASLLAASGIELNVGTSLYGHARVALFFLSVVLITMTAASLILKLRLRGATPQVVHGH